MENKKNDINEETLSSLSVRVAKTEDRAKSNTHRLNRMEKLTDAIHAQNENIVRLVEKLETVNSSLDAQEKRLSEIEKLPRQREGAVFAAAVTALISSLIGAAVSFLLTAI